MMIQSLLFREFFIMRRTLLGSCILHIMMTVLLLLVRLSAIFGNLSHAVADVDAVNEIVLSLSLCLFPAMYLQPMGCSIDMLTSDIRSHYRLFSYTLPVTPLQLTAARYLRKLICFGVGCAWTGVMIRILYMTAQDDEALAALQELRPMVYLIILLSVLKDTLDTPLLLRCRTVGGVHAVQNGVLGGLAVLCFAGVTLVMSYLIKQDLIADFLEQLTDLGKNLPVLTPIAVFVLLVVGFGCSISAVGRREK